MKKLNKFFAILVALAMMAMLCVTTALAEPAPASTADGTDAGSAANAKIVKYLQIPEGVNPATAPKTFTVTFTPYTVSASSLDVEDMPAIAPKTITVSLPTQVTDDGQSLYGFIDLGFLSALEWPGNGVYTYIVEEVDGGDAAITYDKGAYAINIYKEADGIKHVTGQEVEVTPEQPANPEDPESEPTPKTYTIKDGKEDVTVTDPTVPTDPTDPDLNDEEDPEDDDKVESEKVEGKIKTEGLTFTNVYTVSSTGDQKYGALSIQKNVDADTVDTTANFPFSLTITAPTGHEGESFKATVWDANGKVNTAEAGADPAYIEYNFVDGVAQTFTLKAGQYLKFETADLPAGAKYTVGETLSTSNVNKKDMYTPSYVLTTADTDTVATGTKADDATAGQDLAIGVTPLIKEASTKELADYTNKFDDDLNTPTGILISNLPYIALALVAIGGLVAYVVVRRKADDEA